MVLMVMGRFIRIYHSMPISDDQRCFWIEYQDADENIYEDIGQMGVEGKTFAPTSHNALTRIEEYVQ